MDKDILSDEDRRNVLKYLAMSLRRLDLLQFRFSLIKMDADERLHDFALFWKLVKYYELKVKRRMYEN